MNSVNIESKQDPATSGGEGGAEAPSAISRRDAIRRAALFLGIAVSPAWMEGLLAAQATAKGSGAKPQHLSAEQFEIAGAVAERILPRTETPGAKDVGVPAFIDLIVGGYFTETERKTLLDGFADLQARSRRAHRSGFAQLAPAAQDGLLREIAAESQAKEKTFFHLIKDLTLIGYFTSEEIGKNVTHWEPIPGRFEACIPLSEVGNRAWTR